MLFRSFFGQKDAQQVAVIKRLAQDLGFETEIVVMPTMREPSGLAMSSRNSLLSPEMRDKAAILIEALRAAKTEFKKGQRNAADLAEIVRNSLADQPAVRLDYVDVVDRDTLEPVEKIGDNEYLIVLAAYVDDVRLIDNVILNRKQ